MPNPEQQTSRQNNEGVATAYVALGSNLGDRESHLRSAIQEIGRIGSVELVSSFYETDPVGDIPQPDFLNAVLEVRTSLPAESLLSALLQIEQQHGRNRAAVPPKGPRTLDLDLLSYGDQVLRAPNLTLPHPAIAERRFVLVPLAEIAPEWRHPVSGKTAAEMLAELPPENRRVSRLLD
jgi:2-amino-4-hydroxy-6-hydroxymethyldihydropteridine diphosphokinase